MSLKCRSLETHSCRVVEKTFEIPELQFTDKEDRCPCRVGQRQIRMRPGWFRRPVEDSTVADSTDENR